MTKYLSSNTFKMHGRHPKLFFCFFTASITAPFTVEQSKKASQQIQTNSANHN